MIVVRFLTSTSDFVLPVALSFIAGESADEPANDYGCAREKIEEAIRCELTLAEAA